MVNVNKNFFNLEDNYLFDNIKERTVKFMEKNPDKPLIKLGIGDVTLPLPPVVVKAMKKAADELLDKKTFKGYPTSEGYEFLRNAIARYYKGFGVDVDPAEIFVSDGAKSDTGNITDIFSADNTALISDPVYPVYEDSNIMGARKIVKVAATPQTDFCAMPDLAQDADLIYLCSPNNPTGAAYTFEQLKTWVDYANEQGAIIFYDAAYEAFIADEKKYPRSIFAVDGARTCAIEFASLSKTAGFTGVRCGYTVIPKELKVGNVSIKDLWYRRQSTKFNGVSYPVQRAAQAIFTPEGQAQIRKNIDYYMENARFIAGVMEDLGIDYTGGENSPYIWFKCPKNMGSWEFFDELLERAQVVGTPGEGFGENGRGWFRFTAFGDKDDTKLAMEKFRTLIGELNK